MSSLAAAPAPVSRASLGDLVYQRLVEGLLEGAFECGAELNEIDLANRFDVSRTPVREALRRLAAEGLVVNSPNRQTTVIRLSREDVAEAYEVRELLEAAACRRAASRMTAADLSRLRQLAAAAVPADGQEWGNAERRFDDELHRLIALRCGNTRLARELTRYQQLVRFVRTRAGRNPAALAQGHAEHLEVLRALEARDAAAAERAMSNHIESALNFVLNDIRWEEVGEP